ncbi:unnamed protein product [Notodromas monacha]|uniref:Kinesin motor domain-containing protein n=1 Tax=Notodromas monacha TaxID=399045 RepID=A0A7R9BDM1_9CRUS|nr:unnamed protein product [Notodromas monacha]CAG0912554.1 unnamed protein product [Notodromas monacha]
MQSNSASEPVSTFLRVRPFRDGEQKTSCFDSIGNREVKIVDKHHRFFQFSKAFGPTAKQVDVYEAAVKPLLKDVLAGHSCNVFLYGQSGTGKTHTLLGGRCENDGILPQFLESLCTELGKLENETYASMSVFSVANEDLRDMSGVTRNSNDKKLRLVEDQSRKGSIVIQGADSITVRLPLHGLFSQLNRAMSEVGLEQLRKSSLIFTITVYIIEVKPNGEEVTMGKINFFDLAGSENLGKSTGPLKGKDANAHLSLITFSRLVTMLSEGAKHLPYRDSKLTRFAQDALGGKGRTNFIFTTFGGTTDIQETQATLEFSAKARQITTTPEVFSTFSKNILTKYLEEESRNIQEEINRVVKKQGVYVDPDVVEKQNAEFSKRSEDLVALRSDLVNCRQRLAFLKLSIKEIDAQAVETQGRILSGTQSLSKIDDQILLEEAKLLAKRDAIQEALSVTHSLFDERNTYLELITIDKSLRDRHEACLKQLRYAWEEGLVNARLHVENLRIMNRSCWDMLNTLPETIGLSKELQQKAKSLDEASSSIDEHFEDMKALMEAQVKKFEDLGNHVAQADKERLEALNVAYHNTRLKMEKYVEQQTQRASASYERLIQELDKLIRENEKCVALTVEGNDVAKELVSKLNGVHSDSLTVEGQIFQKISEESDNAEARAERIVDEIAPRILKDFDEISANQQEWLIFLDNAISQVEHCMENRNQGWDEMKALTGDFDKKMYSICSDRNRQLDKISKLAGGMQNEMNESAHEFGIQMNNLAEDMKHVCEERDERLRDIEQIEMLELLMKAQSLAAADPAVVDRVLCELDDFKRGLQEAVKNTEVAVKEIKDECSQYKLSDEMKAEFVDVAPTGLTPVRKDYSKLIREVEFTPMREINE